MGEPGRYTHVVDAAAKTDSSGMSAELNESDLTTIAGDIIQVLKEWRESKRNKKGKIDANVFCAGLYVTQQLALKYPLEDPDYLTESQVKTASGKNAREILATHGETRKFLQEAGRTSRLTRPMAVEIANIVNMPDWRSSLKGASNEDRGQIAWLLQAWFVQQLRIEWFAKGRIKAAISHDKPVSSTISSILNAAGKAGGNLAGAVAQHLVGSKLALRFPDLAISNDSYTTADQQTARPGDFLVGDSAIHVTMNPVSRLFEARCVENVAHGYRPRVLVPEVKVAGARLMAANVSDKIAVQSIEDFVGTNIEEMSGFAGEKIRQGLRTLLEKYNERVQKVESDPGILIEVPTNL